MGNHDYWNLLKYSKENIEEKQKLFEEKTKEKPYSHKIINGYHFINWSCDNASLEMPIVEHSWFKKQIEIAASSDNKKPIFVTTIKIKK